MSSDRDSIQSGFSVQWLAEAFNMSAQTVRNRLADCPVKGRRGRGTVYDLREAAAYLVQPNIDWETHLKGLRKSDLPTALQKDIWDARIKQQRFEREARDLWHTNDVVDKFTTIFLAVKSNIQLWPDTVERQIGVTDEQRALLVEMGDALLEDIYRATIDSVADHSTPSSVEALEGLDETVL